MIEKISFPAALNSCSRLMEALRILFCRRLKRPTRLLLSSFFEKINFLLSCVFVTAIVIKTKVLRLKSNKMLNCGIVTLRDHTICLVLPLYSRKIKKKV